MIEKDPIQEVESIVKKVNTSAGRYTKNVLERYPLLFALLVTFALASILDGFKLYVEEIDFFVKHPLVLVLIGVVILLFTGTLYKTLQKHSE